MLPLHLPAAMSATGSFRRDIRELGGQLRVRTRHKGRVPVGLLTDQEAVLRTRRPRLRPLFSAALDALRRRPSSQPGT